MIEASAPIRGVLLDVDGTLIDSNDAHALAWVDVLRRHQYDREFVDVRPLIGMGGDKLIPAVTGLDAEDERAKAMSTARRELFLRRYVPTLQAFDGAHELVEELRARGLTVVVATSAERDELAPMLEHVGLSSLLDDSTSSSDAERSKPDPDIIRAALAKGGLEPGEAVLIGDTPYDITAATNAGVGTVALRCGGWWRDDQLHGALRIYNDPRALLQRLDEILISAA